MAIASFSHIGLNCENPIDVECSYTKHRGFRQTRVYVPGPALVVMI
jgi:hypothetical protein